MKKIVFGTFTALVVGLFAGCTAYNTSTDYYVVISNKSEIVVNGNNSGVFKGDYSDSRTIEEIESQIYFNEEECQFDLSDQPNFFVRGLPNDNKEYTKLLSFNRGASSNDYDTTCKYGNIAEGDSAEFYVTNDKDFDKIMATLEKAGTHCNVWVDNGIDVTSALVNNLQEKFDSIYEAETNIIGQSYLNVYKYNNVLHPTNTDKIQIFVTDLYGDGPKGNVLGFFYPLDFYSIDNYDPSDSSTEILQYSNQTEIIYIDSYWLEEYPETQYSTLAHEFNHLVNYLQKLNKAGDGPSTWLTEMLAMSMEDVLQDKIGIGDFDSPKARLSTFNQYPYGGFTLDDLWHGEDALVAYANGYAFGAYLTRNYGGVKLLKEIATNSYLDEEAVTQALHAVGYSSESYSSVLAKFGEVYFNVNNNFNSAASLNKGYTDQQLGDFKYNISKIDLNHNYLGSKYSWYVPQVLSADDYNFRIFPSGFVVKHVVSNENWTVEKKVKKQNSNLTYRQYN